MPTPREEEPPMPTPSRPSQQRTPPRQPAPRGSATSSGADLPKARRTTRRGLRSQEVGSCCWTPSTGTTQLQQALRRDGTGDQLDGHRSQRTAAKQPTTQPKTPQRAARPRGPHATLSPSSHRQAVRRACAKSAPDRATQPRRSARGHNSCSSSSTDGARDAATQLEQARRRDDTSDKLDGRRPMGTLGGQLGSGIEERPARNPGPRRASAGQPGNYPIGRRQTLEASVPAGCRTPASTADKPPSADAAGESVAPRRRQPAGRPRAEASDGWMWNTSAKATGGAETFGSAGFLRQVQRPTARKSRSAGRAHPRD